MLILTEVILCRLLVCHNWRVVSELVEVLLRLLLLVELNDIIRNKDDKITDLMNLVYHRSDDAEKLI
jgi:hypothetical protein